MLPLGLFRAGVHRRAAGGRRGVGLDLRVVPLPDAVPAELPGARRSRPACATCRSRWRRSSSPRLAGRLLSRVPARALLAAASRSSAWPAADGRHRPGDEWTALLGGFLARAGRRDDQPGDRRRRGERRAEGAERDGVGINDTFRQVGIAVGIAAWGAIFLGRGADKVRELAAGTPVRPASPRVSSWRRPRRETSTPPWPTCRRSARQRGECCPRGLSRRDERDPTLGGISRPGRRRGLALAGARARHRARRRRPRPSCRVSPCRRIAAARRGEPARRPAQPPRRRRNRGPAPFQGRPSAFPVACARSPAPRAGPLTGQSTLQHGPAGGQSKPPLRRPKDQEEGDHSCEICCLRERGADAAVEKRMDSGSKRLDRSRREEPEPVRHPRDRGRHADPRGRRGATSTRSSP